MTRAAANFSTLQQPRFYRHCSIQQKLQLLPQVIKSQLLFLVYEYLIFAEKVVYFLQIKGFFDARM